MRFDVKLSLFWVGIAAGLYFFWRGGAVMALGWWRW